MNVRAQAIPVRRETLNLRIKAEERRLIDRAAMALGKNRTEFVLEAVRRAANDVLLDRRDMTVSPADFVRFVELLDAKPVPNERLKRTMRTAAPWDDK